MSVNEESLGFWIVGWTERSKIRNSVEHFFDMIMLSFSVNAPVKLCHEKDIAASDEPTDGDQHLGVFQLTVFDFGLAISATNNLISSYSRQLTVPLYPDQR